MKKYKVVLDVKHSAKPNQIIDGCLGNIFDDGEIALYDRGEAVKKARVFGGKIEEVIGLHNAMHRQSIMCISENALLDGVVRELEGRETFNPNTENERVFDGSIFETIAGEQGELEGTPMQRNWKVLKQLQELSELVDTDYVMITQR